MAIAMLNYQRILADKGIILVVPRKAVAEASKIGRYRRGVAVMHGWQSETTHGPKGGWSCVFWNVCSGCSGHLTNNCWT